MIDLKMKSLFFDRAAVINAVGRAKAGTMSRMGAFVRKRARSLIRKRKKVSAAGSPPSDHGGALKRLLFFAYDPSSQSAVVGPEKFGSTNGANVLEFGGKGTFKAGGKARTANYAARPFMRPALDAEVAAGTLPTAWKNSIKGN